MDARNTINRAVCHQKMESDEYTYSTKSLRMKFCTLCMVGMVTLKMAVNDGRYIQT